MPFFEKTVPSPPGASLPSTVPSSHAALLQELDCLPHSVRMARMARLGASPEARSSLVPLVHALSAGDAYEARLALVAALHARMSGVILDLLHHPSVRIRIQAAGSLLGTGANDDTIADAVTSCAPAVRKRILQSVVASPRAGRERATSHLADLLLALVLRRYPDREAALLLPACSPEVVAEHLPVLHHVISHWRSLAGRFPEIVLPFIEQSFREAPERERAILWERYDSALHELALAHPERVLRLALDHPHPDRLAPCLAARSGALARRLPEFTVKVMELPEYRTSWSRGGLPHSLLSSIPGLSDEHCLALAALLRDAPEHLAALLARLAPSRRAPLFELLAPSDSRVWPEVLLQVLPHELRHREVRRMLACRQVREDPTATLRLMAFETWDVSRPLLDEATQAPRADDRAQAWRLLVASCGYHRRGLDEILSFMLHLKSEQDPVRLAALQTLACLPVSLFQESHVPALTEIVAAAMLVGDSSDPTRKALQSFALRLLRVHAGAPAPSPLFLFALGLLKDLEWREGTPGTLPPLDDLPRGAEQHVVATLTPVIRAAGRNESFRLAIDLARALGRRAWTVESLQILLETVTEAKSTPLAASAVALWLAPPRTRDARVMRLLEHDASVVAVPEVFEHLHRRRQDLLDPYLKGRTLPGAFAKVAYEPPATEGFWRWLPRQQRAFGACLERMAEDIERPAGERASAIHRLGRLETATTEQLRPWLDDEDVQLQEATLSALSCLDDVTPSLAILLEHLHGDRARVAMCAVPRVAGLIDPDLLAQTLSHLLDRPHLHVTVHKEVLRLLGTCRPEGAMRILRSQWALPEMHRDVRIAVLHAARNLLHDTAAWTFLEEASASTDRFMALSVLEQRPAELPPKQRPAYAALVMRAARHRDVRVRKVVYSVLPSWSPGLEEVTASVAAACVARLDAAPEWRDALSALVEITKDGHAQDALLDLVRTLAATREPDRPALPLDRDQPATQRLLATIAELEKVVLKGRWSRAVHAAHTDTVRHVAGILDGDPTMQAEAAALHLACLDLADLDNAIPALRALASELDEQAWALPATLERLVRLALPGSSTSTTAGALVPCLTSPSPLDRRCRGGGTSPYPFGTPGSPTGGARWVPLLSAASSGVPRYLQDAALEGVAEAEARSLLSIAAALADHDSVSSHHMSVALLAVAGPSLDWNDDSVSLLLALRRDADTGVRTAARRLFTCRE